MVIRFLAVGAAIQMACLAGMADELPMAPEGYEWVLLGSSTYTASENIGVDLSTGGTVNGGPQFANLGRSLTLATFNASDTPADTYQFVLDSTYSASIGAVGNATIFNFSTGSEDYNGVFSLNTLKISGATDAGPVTDQLVRPNTDALTIGAFGSAPFTDASSGASSLSINLSSTGVAPTDGSSLTFSFTGSAVSFFQSTSGSATGDEFFSAPAVATVQANVSTFYQTWQLEAIPEPSVVTLFAVGLLLVTVRRRRR